MATVKSSFDESGSIEERIAAMTLDEAYEWIRKSHSIYHTKDQPLIDAANVIVEGHEEKVRGRGKKQEADAVQPVSEADLWKALPWHKKLGYTIADWFQEPVVFNFFTRLHIGLALAVIVIGAWVALSSPGGTPAAEATPVPPLAELLAKAPDAAAATPSDGSVSTPDTSLLLSAPTAQAVVDCTAQTCPDAQQYTANYPFADDPDGSATLRSLDGKTVLGQIPKGTPVWIITTSIEKGKFCLKMPGTTVDECRRGQIKPIASLPFTYQGGWISFTAVQPVSP